MVTSYWVSGLNQVISDSGQTILGYADFSVLGLVN